MDVKCDVWIFRGVDGFKHVLTKQIVVITGGSLDGRVEFSQVYGDLMRV